jgi:tetratricopeptide (TPR) repeat protein
MEKKKKEPKQKVVRNFREEIIDFQIDLTKLEFKKKTNLIGEEDKDGKIIKYVLEEGKGSPAKSGATIYYHLESRYPNGVLCNPRDDRKGVKKILLKKDELSIALEIALTQCQFGEEFWCKIDGKRLKSLKYYKDIPEIKECGPKGDEIWFKFHILKIKHPINKSFCDFETLVTFINDCKNRAKEYLQLAAFDTDEYEYAAEVYKVCIQDLVSMQKTIKATMQPSDNENKNSLLLSLYSSLAHTYLKQNSWQDAKNAAEKALEIDKTNLKAAFRLALACYSDNLFDKAYDAFSICFEKEGNNPDLAPYKEWFINYKNKKVTAKSKVDHWKKYNDLIEYDEINKKQARKVQRTGVSNEEEDKKKEDSFEEDVEIDNNSGGDPEADSGWGEVIKEEQKRKEELKKQKEAKKAEESKKSSIEKEEKDNTNP